MPTFDLVLRRIISLPPVLRLAQRAAASLDPVTLASAVPNELSLDRLDAGTAALLNMEKGPRGFAAAAGVWVNQPVGLWYGPGSVTVKEVNERIVEVPYVLASVLHGLPAGGRVLDFGASESTVALSLASLGYQVTALDSRGYPFAHPNLEVVTTLVEHWAGPAEPFDRILALSAIEHVGIGFYDKGEGDHLDDRGLLALFAKWLAPNGMVTVTVPYGPWNVDEFQRTYDDEHLDALFDEWTILGKRVFSRQSATAWEPGTAGAPSVAVVDARFG